MAGRRNLQRSEVQQATGGTVVVAVPTERKGALAHATDGPRDRIQLLLSWQCRSSSVDLEPLVTASVPVE